jgi:hypothetical protein
MPSIRRRPKVRGTDMPREGNRTRLSPTTRFEKLMTVQPVQHQVLLPIAIHQLRRNLAGSTEQSSLDKAVKTLRRKYPNVTDAALASIVSAYDAASLGARMAITHPALRDMRVGKVLSNDDLVKQVKYQQLALPLAPHILRVEPKQDVYPHGTTITIHGWASSPGMLRFFSPGEVESFGARRR